MTVVTSGHLSTCPRMLKSADALGGRWLRRPRDRDASRAVGRRDRSRCRVAPGVEGRGDRLSPRRRRRNLLADRCALSRGEGHCRSDRTRAQPAVAGVARIRPRSQRAGSGDRLRPGRSDLRRHDRRARRDRGSGRAVEDTVCRGLRGLAQRRNVRSRRAARRRARRACRTCRRCAMRPS